MATIHECDMAADVYEFLAGSPMPGAVIAKLSLNDGNMAQMLPRQLEPLVAHIVERGALNR